MRALSALLDEPQRTYPTIHITGTNGKTTTARLASALACEHGLTTGLFTSPHLEAVTERHMGCDEPGERRRRGPGPRGARSPRARLDPRRGGRGEGGDREAGQGRRRAGAGARGAGSDCPAVGGATGQGA